MTPLDLISLAQAKEYLKVDFADEDSLIEMLIEASVQEIEQETGQRLYDRSEVVHTIAEIYTTAIHPINSVTSVTDDGEPIVLDDNYEVEDQSYGKVFIFDTDTAKVITLNVGYTTGNCPALLRLACLNLIEYKYNNRGGSDLPNNIAQAISTFRTSPW